MVLLLESRGEMITNPEWHKPKEKPYFHQISLDCIEKLVDCLESFGIDVKPLPTLLTNF